MAYTTTIPGLPGGTITTNHEIRVKLIPAWNTYQRPGIKAQWPRRSVQHGTGNPKSMAPGEATYVVDQQAEGRQASYHSITDDNVSYICLPADEVGWHAADGAGPGNMCGFANEQVENAALWASPDRALQAIENSAELMGIVSARLTIVDPEQHWTFNYMDPDRHDCPQKLRRTYVRGVLGWDIYAPRWRAHKAAELARMAGKPAPSPSPVAPSGEPVRPGARVQVTERLNVRRGYGLSFSVIATLDPGTLATVGADPDNRYMIDRDGYTWLNIAFAGDSGWAASNWLEVVTPAPEPEEPAVTYAKPLIVDALYDTDLAKYDTAPGIVSKDGADWIFVADVVEATRDTPRLQYAAKDAPSIGPIIRKGEGFVVAWIVKAADGAWYYLTPWWSRVRVTDTVRISDAPLLTNDKAAVKPTKTLTDVMDELA